MNRAASPEILELASDGLELRLCPDLGGSIAALRWRHRDGDWLDLLRPATTATLAGRDIEGMACFPLSPYSNRLRDGRFEFRGETIALPVNAVSPHAEHGHGWRRPWQCVELARENAVLRLVHEPDGWPFAYTMEQRFRLDAEGLDVEIATRNDGPTPMPYGFGLHPYFPRTNGCRLSATVEGFWETDAEIMPTRHMRPPAEADPTQGLKVAAADLDNCFTGWRHRAVIDWPERRTRLTMTATAPLDFFVIYTPLREDYFCAEPVSNCTDAFNLAASRDDSGMLVLEPGQSISARVGFRAEATG
jgi:aldose 1-epimerase